MEVALRATPIQTWRTDQSASYGQGSPRSEPVVSELEIKTENQSPRDSGQTGVISTHLAERQTVGQC